MRIHVVNHKEVPYNWAPVNRNKTPEKTQCMNGHLKRYFFSFACLSSILLADRVAASSSSAFLEKSLVKCVMIVYGFVPARDEMAIAKGNSNGIDDTHLINQCITSTFIFIRLL